MLIHLCLPCVFVCVSMNIVKWSSQGMLRLTQEAMNELFQPTIFNIVKHIGEKLKPEIHEIQDTPKVMITQHVTKQIQKHVSRSAISHNRIFLSFSLSKTMSKA